MQHHRFSLRLLIFISRHLSSSLSCLLWLSLTNLLVSLFQLMASDPSSTLVIAIFAISLVNLTPSLVLARKPCHFPAIFNFGDSNSDTGGLSAAFGQAPPPNGLSYFGGPAGRYADGRLVIDFIGTFYFSAKFLSPYNKKSTRIRKGMNVLQKL